MKRLLLSLLGIVISVFAANAEKVTEQQALQKAMQFMKCKNFSVAPRKSHTRGSSEDDKAFFIFNVENNGGFVIVSGDDRTEPILGYSNHGNLYVDSVPANVKWLLDYYEKALTAIANDKAYTRPARTRTGEERVTVKPLMATEWGQNFPYNLKCPTVDGKRTVTGCVATALAQVLNYNCWPKDYTSSVPAYTTFSKQIYMPQLEPIKFGWGSVSLQFLSDLMLYCGQAVQMNYGVDESGADVSVIPGLLKTVFGYNDGAQYVVKENYTDEEWDNMMYAEMVGGRPVIYSGFGEQSTGFSGHAFVIDGYDSGRYHVNWGWDGQSNGLFMLTGLNVKGATYNDHQSAVIGFQSPEGISKAVIPKVQVYDISHKINKKYLWRQNDGKFPAIEISASVYGTSSEKETLQLGWGLFNENGLVAVYAQEQNEICPDISEGYCHNASIIVDEDIADGDYSLLPVCRSSDSEEWVADAPNIMELGLRPDYYTEIHIYHNLMKLIYDKYSTVYERESQGYVIKDGIVLDLWKEIDDKHYATVISPQTGNYSGDIMIPDQVSQNSKDYSVYDADLSTFENCLELTSLSTSMVQVPRIDNCPKLTTIEFREGVSASNAFYLITSCESLKSIRFNSIDQLIFKGCPFGVELPALKDVYFLSMYPPCPPPLSEGFDAFPVNENVTLHIPVGAMPVYKNSMWKDWNLADDQIVDSKGIKWGYYIDNNTNHYNSPEIGSFDRCDVDLAIRVPAEMIDKYQGQKITGIEFFCINMLNSNFPDYVFITKPGVDYLVKQSANISQTTGWKSVMLSEPYTITGEELFVGIGRNYIHDYSTSINDPNEYDGQWSRFMDENKKWENRSNESIGHPLTLRFIIEGNDLPKDLKICQPKLIEEKTSNKIQAFVVNRCSELLTSYIVSWDFDGKVKGTKTIETSLASNLTETLEIEVPSDLEGYYHTLTLDVVSVNGEEDAISANSHLIYDFSSSANHFPRKMVLENFVGTWCGWSPRAYSVVEKMYEKYPKNFISIGIHENTTYGVNDEVGEPYNYKTYIEAYTATPTFLVNRFETIDTNLNEIVAAYEKQKDDADAMIKANADFASEDCTSVMVKTATTFGFTDNGNADFRIAYVVLEDNVGPYNQANFYSDTSMPDNPDDYMNEWYKKGNPVEMRFNGVARGIYGSLNGTDGSVPKSVVAGKPYEYEYTFDLPDNIQNKSNISIVTLLIDNKTGEIMNAAKCKIGVNEDDENTTSPITIGKSGKASYCGDKSLDFSFSDEVKAYIATGFDKDEGTIWLTRVKDVPAGVPVLIKGGANKTYDVPVTNSQNSYYTNMFVGNTSGEKIQIQETDGDMVNYYLSGDGTFKSVNKTANIGTNKCYLQLPRTFEAAATGATETVTVGSIGKASFAAPVDLDFTNVSGLKAFTATGYDKSTKTIWLTRVMKVQKGEGVLLKGDPNSYEIPSVAVQSSYENMFVGNTSGDQIQVNETSEDGSQTNFYLKGDGSFVSVKGYVNIKNNKCYLALPTSMVAVSSTRSAEDDYKFEEPEVIKLPIEFKSIGSEGDGTTGVKEVKSGEVKSDEWFTLQGQRVAKPGKGLYIRNGKVVLVKTSGEAER